MTDGRIDGANAREFQTALDAAIDDNECAVVLDMERLSYISSAGLRVILLTAKALQGRNRKFAICALSESIREVFEISGFDKIIPIHASRGRGPGCIQRMIDSGPFTGAHGKDNLQ